MWYAWDTCVSHACDTHVFEMFPATHVIHACREICYILKFYMWPKLWKFYCMTKKKNFEICNIHVCVTCVSSHACVWDVSCHACYTHVIRMWYARSTSHAYHMHGIFTCVHWRQIQVLLDLKYILLLFQMLDDKLTW